MALTPIIPPEYEPNPVPLAFRTKRLDTPGYLARQARYTNEVNQEFVVTIAAETKHRKELHESEEELKLWLRADRREVASPTEGPATPERQPQETEERLIGELQQLAEDGVTGSRIAFEARLVEPGDTRLGPNFAVFLRIDPTVRKGHGRSYYGPDRVLVSVQKNGTFPRSKVRLLDLPGYGPKDGPVIGAAQNRDANHNCRIFGLRKSKFTIDGEQGEGKWKPR